MGSYPINTPFHYSQPSLSTYYRTYYPSTLSVHRRGPLSAHSTPPLTVLRPTHYTVPCCQPTICDWIMIMTVCTCYEKNLEICYGPVGHLLAVVAVAVAGLSLFFRILLDVLFDELMWPLIDCLMYLYQ